MNYNAIDADLITLMKPTMTKHFALGDLYSLRDKLVSNDELILNTLLQGLLSIATLHKLGFIHTKCDASKFLCIKSSDNPGYYHYDVLGTHYYIKNCGYQVVLHNFDTVVEYPKQRPKHYNKCDKQYNMNTQDIEFKYDSYDYIMLMYTFLYEELGLSSKVKDFLQQIFNLMTHNKFSNENELIKRILESFVTKCPDSSIIVGKQPSGHILNKKATYIIPYVNSSPTWSPILSPSPVPTVSTESSISPWSF